MNQYGVLFMKALELLVWLVVQFKDNRLRGEGRKKVLDQIEERNEQQSNEAARISESNRNTPLADLEHRMRHRQRTTED